MTYEKAQPPKYTVEGSPEWTILNDAERYFKDRDEKLRFYLVRRVLQWMLDTDENGWFEKTESQHDKRSRKETIDRSGEWETYGYIRTLKGGVANGRLTGEVDALYEYLVELETILKGDETLPEDYEKRRRIIQGSIMPDGRYERALRPLSWLSDPDQYQSM